MNRTIHFTLLLLCISLSLPSLLKAQNKNKHYVQTHLMTEEDGSRSRETVTYYDSFGLEYETLEVDATPQGKDLQTPIGYDGFFRKTMEFLPRPAGNTDFYADANPYHYTVYENSELNRVREAYGPGQTWQENGKAVKYAYLVNKASGVLSCSYYQVEELDRDIKLTRSGNYTPGELTITQVTDEDGHITYTFSDSSGRLVLTRQMNGTVAHDTYIVYDDRGRKRVVLPPSAADALTAVESWLCSQNEPIQLYGYIYRYDGRDRCIEKKLPGCAPIYYVYDKSDRMVLKQDGNDREVKRWQSYQYDHLGRQVIWGFLKSPSSHQYWITFCQNKVLSVGYTGAQTPMENYGYSSVSQISLRCTPLIINYYDDYDYTNIFSEFIGSQNRPGYYSSFASSPKSSYGKLTGQVVALLNDPSKKDYIAYYYDRRGREVQRTANSAFGFKNYTFTNYNFTDQPVSVRKEHTSIYPDAASGSTGVASHVTTYEYEYDPAGRVSKLYHTFDSDPRVLMADYRYDEVGRLETKLIHNHADTASYKYNVRGWPTEINEPGMREKIYYNEDLPQGVTPLYNGNIPCLSNSVNTIPVARFTYDGLNRLLSTRRYKMDGRPTEHGENFTYDKMGNLLTYQRVFEDFYPDYTTKLAIKYHGNQIQSATDERRSVGYYNLRYLDDQNADVEYFYDSNGNLVKNLDNRIGKIKNNILNLPEVVAFTDGNLLTFSYMADGRKVRDSYGSYPIKPTTPLDTVVNNTDPYITGINDWSEDYYYQSKKLRRVTTSDGHLNFYDSPDHTTYYTTKDHIGCTWQRKVGSRNALMYPNYYPSGIMDLKPYPTYPFGLGGKEFMSTNYLDEYYFGARTMYAIMNRFNQVDPLCEEYYSVSPYAYALNNPVRYKDPDGRFPWPVVPIVLGWLLESQPVNAPTLNRVSNARNMEAAWNSYNEGALSNFIPGAKMEAVSTRVFIQKPVEKIVRKTVTSEVREEVGKFVPNPFGRRGGQAHQDKVAEAIKQLSSDGFKEIITEQTIKTLGGEKSRRAVDVRGINPTTGEVKDIQVGRQNKNGTPVAREKRALDDIEKATGQRPIFRPYN